MSSKTTTNQRANQDPEGGISEQKNKFPLRIILIAASIFTFFLIILMILLGVMIHSVNQKQHQEAQPAVKIIEIEESINYVISNTKIPPFDEIRLSEKASVERHPLSQKVEKWKNVSLSCHFDRPVECRWMRRSQPVDITGRYSFTEASLPGDCSIHIRSFREIDEGEWVCVALFEDQSTLDSNTAQLVQIKTTIKPGVPEVAQSQGEEKKVEKGGEIQLACSFGAEVDCAWMRRGEHIDIKGRYAYTGSGNGVGRDCSIKITAAKSIDSGKWQCSSMADANSQGTLLPPIQLIVT